MVFVEILKQFLLNQGYDKRDINFNNDLNNVDRVNVVLAKLSEVVSDDEHKRKIKLFEQCVNDIFVNEDLLIKFVLFLKEVYEWYHVVTYSSNGNSTCSNVQTVRGDVNGDNNDLVGLVNQKKNDVMYSLIRSERFSISPSNRTVCRNYSHSNFNFYLEVKNSTTFSAILTPSAPLEVMPPAKPAPSPAEYKPTIPLVKFSSLAI